MTNTSQQVRGLILRLKELGESDILIDLFTYNKGRLTALAKGGKRSQKRFFGLLVTGHVLDLELAPSKKGGSLWLLNQAQLVDAHLGLRTDYRRFLSCYPVFELLLRATAAMDPLPSAFDLSYLTLNRISKARETREMASALIVFLTRLLCILGYELRLDSCLNCSCPQNKIQTCSLSLAGGLICEKCRQAQGNIKVPPGLIKSLETANNMDFDALIRLYFTSFSCTPALTFLTRFWQETICHDLQSLQIASNFLKKNL